MPPGITARVRANRVAPYGYDSIAARAEAWLLPADGCHASDSGQARPIVTAEIKAGVGRPSKQALQLPRSRRGRVGPENQLLRGARSPRGLATRGRVPAVRASGRHRALRTGHRRLLVRRPALSDNRSPDHANRAPHALWKVPIRIRQVVDATIAAILVLIALNALLWHVVFPGELLENYVYLRSSPLIDYELVAIVVTALLLVTVYTVAAPTARTWSAAALRRIVRAAGLRPGAAPPLRPRRE